MVHVTAMKGAHLLAANENVCFLQKYSDDFCNDSGMMNNWIVHSVHSSFKHPVTWQLAHCIQAPFFVVHFCFSLFVVAIVFVVVVGVVFIVGGMSPIAIKHNNDRLMYNSEYFMRIL